MLETITCSICGRSLPATSFSAALKDAAGNIIRYRRECKACRSKKELARQKRKAAESIEIPESMEGQLKGVTTREVPAVEKDRQLLTVPKNEVYQSTPEKQEQSSIEPLTDNEIKAVRDLLLVLPDIKKLLKPERVEENLLQGMTLPKTFKVYASVLDKFNQYISGRPGEKLQDIVSMALVEYMNNH